MSVLNLVCDRKVTQQSHNCSTLSHKNWYASLVYNIQHTKMVKKKVFLIIFSVQFVSFSMFSGVGEMKVFISVTVIYLCECVFLYLLLCTCVLQSKCRTLLWRCRIGINIQFRFGLGGSLWWLGLEYAWSWCSTPLLIFWSRNIAQDASKPCFVLQKKWLHKWSFLMLHEYWRTGDGSHQCWILNGFSLSGKD